MISLILNKGIDIQIEGIANAPYGLTVKQAANYMASRLNGQVFVSAKWKVFSGADIDQQNKTFLRRLNKLAGVLGAKVVGFDNIMGNYYGASLFWE